MIRSQKDPHAFEQPEYVGDTYYLPNSMKPSQENDYGGVHKNSSLLSALSYKLYQAGMDVNDQIYFWVNVDLSISPTTDYAQLAEILPWCMKMTGYPEYVEALEQAIAEEKLEVRIPPTED